MTDKNIKRRSALRLIGASSAISMTGLASAGEPDNTGLDEKHDLPHNLSATNFTNQDQSVTLSIVNPDTETIVHKRTVQLRAAEGEGDSFITITLPAGVSSKGQHKLIAENKTSRDTSSIYLDGSGLPSFVKGTAMVKPNGEIKVTSSMA